MGAGFLPPKQRPACKYTELELSRMSPDTAAALRIRRLCEQAPGCVARPTFDRSMHLELFADSDAGVVERAEMADALPIISGGSLDDHPTQALTDIYTLNRELGGVDGIRVAVVGRLEHRNVSALLKGLALFNDVKITLVPFSGHLDPHVITYCEARGMELVTEKAIESVGDADAVYLNGPRTLAHVQLLKSRELFNLRINDEFMSMLKPHAIVMDPMQRSGDFSVEVQDQRLAFYRQAENSLTVRMAVLRQTLA